jgi:hypothetical protein
MSRGISRRMLCPLVTVVPMRSSSSFVVLYPVVSAHPVCFVLSTVLVPVALWSMVPLALGPLAPWSLWPLALSP